MRSSYSQGDEPVPGFRLVSFLGAGPLSQVWKAAAPGGASAALKIIRLNSKQALKEFAAVRRFKQIRHPHLVPLIAFWLRDEKGKLIDERLVGEWFFAQARAVDLLIAMGLGDKSLADRLQEWKEKGEPGIPREELLGFIADAAQGIDYLNQPIHDLGAGPVAIVHCDIKPQNIIVAGNAAQICDLGIARVLGELRNTTPVGSAAYIAPEILSQSQPSAATDQYSLAISYHELRTGQLPLHAHSVAGAYFTHLQGKLDLGRLPEAERAIIARATALQPDQRFPNCAALAQALKRLRGHLELVQREKPREADPKLLLNERGATAGDHLSPAPTPTLEAPTSPALLSAKDADIEPQRERTRVGARVGVGAGVGRRPRRFRWRATVPLLLLAAAVLGSLGAWLTRSSAVAVVVLPSRRDALATPPTIGDPGILPGVDNTNRTPEPPPVSEPFVIEGSAESFGTLAAAISGARDRDTVVINGNGPFAVRPLQVQGKALTIRAGAGFRPVIQWIRAGRVTQNGSEEADPSWQPLLATDRSLTLEGLDLCRDEKELPGQTGRPAHFVWSQLALLRMIDCRLHAPHDLAAVVCRDSPGVELRSCSLAALSLALCVEVGENSPCAIQLSSNTISVEEPDGTAVCVYAAEIDRHAQARLLLEGNSVRAGRLATFKALPGGIQIEARDNDITVGRALFNFVGFPRIDGWRRACRWKGEHNRYFGPAEWIQVDGVSAIMAKKAAIPRGAAK
jgi:serine/threonine protein kinase